MLAALIGSTVSAVHMRPELPSAPMPQRQRSLLDLWQHYSEAPVIDRWAEYAEHYERHFPSPMGKRSLKMLEIGVQSGGSARAWHHYYGDRLTYVGVDINERCMRTESPEENIFIEIGSQLNTTFLREVCDRRGPFDMVIDDGGHSGTMMNVSLTTIFAHAGCLTDRAVYVIEDMHTMAMCKEGFCEQPSQVSNIIRDAFYGMHGHWIASEPQKDDLEAKPPAWASQVRSMALYDSMAFFTRGSPLRSLTRITRGTDHLPYGSGGQATRSDRALADDTE